LRSSELCNLHWGDVYLEPDGSGAQLVLRRPKTAQEGWQRVRLPVGLSDATCPVRVLRRWMDVQPKRPGEVWELRPLFVSCRPSARGRGLRRQEIGRIVQRACRAAHLDGAWGSHSLRRGCATAMEDAGVPRHLARAHTRHASDATFSGYVDEKRIRRQVATAGLL